MVRTIDEGVSLMPRACEEAALMPTKSSRFCGTAKPVVSLVLRDFLSKGVL